MVQENFQVAQKLCHVSSNLVLNFLLNLSLLDFKSILVCNCKHFVLNMFICKFWDSSAVVLDVIAQNSANFHGALAFSLERLDNMICDHCLFKNVSHVHIDHLLYLCFQCGFHKLQIMTLLTSMSSIEFQVVLLLILGYRVIFVHE